MIHIATMWDDGLVTDLALIEILRKVGATATFAISPARHKQSRVVNDARGNYGKLVSRSELKEFADFEVCNHTATHPDLGKISPVDTREEIVTGRKLLEDVFGREIRGFCYPYGVFTAEAVKVLAEDKTLYARTTSCGQTRDCLKLQTSGKWNELATVNTDGERWLLFWGHTYELQGEDWARLAYWYELLADHPNVKFVTVSELVKENYAVGGVCIPGSS